MTKTELEEKIKNGESVWVANRWCFPYEVNLTDNHYIDIADNEESLMLAYLDDVELIDYLKYIFETKEKAEWHKEFGCIERTERLVLPTWEEFKNKKIKCVWFTGKETNCLFELYEDTSNNRLILLDHDCDFEYFNAVSTKENYTIACRQCVKLFVGE